MSRLLLIKSSRIEMSELTQSTFLPEKPIGVAIVICDRVITEEGTQNKTIVSTFNTINAIRFPCFHPRLSVYVAMTNGAGEKQIKLRFRDGTPVPLFEMGGSVKFENPNHVVELIFNMKNLLLPQPDVYVFEIYADGEYIFEVKFNAVLQKSEVE